MTTHGDLAAELATLAGLPPTPQQRLVLDRLFDGQDAPFETAVTGPARATLLLQAALGWLFLDGTNLLLWIEPTWAEATHRTSDTAQLLTGSGLRDEFARIRLSRGEGEIATLGGSRLLFRTAKGGRGLAASKLLINGADQLTPADMGSLVPCLASRRHAAAQIICAAHDIPALPPGWTDPQINTWKTPGGIFADMCFRTGHTYLPDPEPANL